MKSQTARVLLYTTRQCTHCRQVKAFLKKHKIPFTEWDIEQNRRAGKEFQRLGGRGVPLILIGQDQVPGFDPDSLGEALRRAGFSV